MSSIRIGVGLLIFDKKQRLLLGKRLAAYNNGYWAVPAGHVKRGETFGQAAKRELFEETGLRARKLELVGLNNYIDAEGLRHYINLDFAIRDYKGRVRNMEPELCNGWEWFELEDLPNPLAVPTEIAIRSLMSGSLIVTESEHIGLCGRLNGKLSGRQKLTR